MHNLSVETVMMFFKALRTLDKDGVVEIPDMIRKFMEEKTGPIVDHLLSSSDSIDDEFLLAMLELPSSSLLVQRCLKSGILPDPIVDLIFKHSNTINVNFLLHDDKRTYVRLITILKSKARSYKDMEKIIDIQQKCISKMCHPYGSVDSLAMSTMGDIAPAPSMVGVQHKPPTAFQSDRPRVREEYQPQSLNHLGSRSNRPHSGDDVLPRGRLQNHNNDDSEYMMPEELKQRQNKTLLQEYNRPTELSRVPETRGTFMSRDSSQDINGTLYNPPRDHRDEERDGDTPFTSKSRDRSPPSRDRLPPAVVAQLKQNLEKNFVAKYPDEKLNPKYNEDRYDCFSDAETYLEDKGRGEAAAVSDGIKSLSLTRLHKKASAVHSAPEDSMQQKTNYAQVYVKKGQLSSSEENKSSFENPNSYHNKALVHANQSDPEMMRALNKLAEQQAIIEHTYDNMSILSHRPANHIPIEKPPPQQDPPSRKRSNSGPKESSRAVEFKHEPVTFQRNGSSNDSSSLQAPIHIPTTFGTTGSTRGSVRSNRPPSPPSNPPPGSTSFFAGGASEAKSTAIARPPPALLVPPPPATTSDPLPQINIESISGLDSGCFPDMPPECIPEYDRVSSPPIVRTPPSNSTASSYPPHSPPAHSLTDSQPFSTEENHDRGREQAPEARGRSAKIHIPDLNSRTGLALTKEELLQQSAVLLNKRSLSKSKERTKERSKERSKSKDRNKGSMRKKKGEKNRNAEKGKFRVIH